MNKAKNPFGVTSSPAFAAAAVLVWIILLALFRINPQWDLDVSAWFFDSAICRATERANGHGCAGFVFSHDSWLVVIREILQPLAVVLAVIAAIMLVWDLFQGRRWNVGAVRLKSVLIAALVLGPGLIVNGVLKQHWGRPRPWMTDQFGGWLPFVIAGDKTHYCASNCSFVSGEASSAGWLMCLALLLFARGRAAWAISLSAVAVAGALLRVAFGAHYLSDAVLGFSMTVVIFTLLATISEMTVRSAG